MLLLIKIIFFVNYILQKKPKHDEIVRSAFENPIVAKVLYSLVLIILLCPYSIADFVSCANILLPAIKIPMANILDVHFILLILFCTLTKLGQNDIIEIEKILKSQLI